MKIDKILVISIITISLAATLNLTVIPSITKYQAWADPAAAAAAGGSAAAAAAAGGGATTIICPTCHYKIINK